MPDQQVVVTVVAGRSLMAKRAFTLGEPIPQFSVGLQGDWIVSAPGVARAHLLLAFDGRNLHAASVDPSAPVYLRGRAINNNWNRLEPSDELYFGQAGLRVTREAGGSLAAPVGPPAASASEAPLVSPSLEVGQGPGNTQFIEPRASEPPAEPAPHPAAAVPAAQARFGVPATQGPSPAALAQQYPSAPAPAAPYPSAPPAPQYASAPPAPAGQHLQTRAPAPAPAHDTPGAAGPRYTGAPSTDEPMSARPPPLLTDVQASSQPEAPAVPAIGHPSIASFPVSPGATPPQFGPLTQPSASRRAELAGADLGAAPNAPPAMQAWAPTPAAPLPGVAAGPPSVGSAPTADALPLNLGPLPALPLPGGGLEDRQPESTLDAGEGLRDFVSRIPPNPPDPPYRLPDPAAEPANPDRPSNYDAYPSSEMAARRVVARQSGSTLTRVLIVVVPLVVALAILALLWFVSIAR